MKLTERFPLSAHLLLMSFLALPAMAADPARHEIGLTLGRLISQDKSSGGTKFNLDGGNGMQANYGYRLFNGEIVAIYGEVHMLANPQRRITSLSGGLTRDVASLFITPGVRVKFAPKKAVSLYFAVGGGWSVFEHSKLTQAGAPNPAPRSTTGSVFDYGGGVDVEVWRFFGLRGEIRDFYSNSPTYNLASLPGRQHNVVLSGGFTLNSGE